MLSSRLARLSRDSSRLEETLKASHFLAFKRTVKKATVASEIYKKERVVLLQFMFKSKFLIDLEINLGTTLSSFGLKPGP